MSGVVIMLLCPVGIHSLCGWMDGNCGIESSAPTNSIIPASIRRQSVSSDNLPSHEWGNDETEASLQVVVNDCDHEQLPGRASPSMSARNNYLPF